VEIEVEVRVVDPVAVVEAERDLDQAPPKRRDERQALGDQVLQVGELEDAARRRRRIDDRHAADVPVVARAFEGQELRVDGRQLAHRL
jgi:hypothetical protein